MEISKRCDLPGGGERKNRLGNPLAAEIAPRGLFLIQLRKTFVCFVHLQLGNEIST
jgi:hypothetical protein